MPNYHSDTFVDNLGAHGVPIKDRRFLLVPLEGSVIGPVDGVPLSLTPEPITAFSADMGWDTEVSKDLAELDLGRSLIASDGMGQVQSVLRVI